MAEERKHTVGNPQAKAGEAMTDGRADAMPDAGVDLGSMPLPKVTFSTFILSLSSSALVHLGEVPEPESGRTMVNLYLAKHTIDILDMLREKTAPCLDADEERLLTGILYELRMKYVLKAK